MAKIIMARAPVRNADLGGWRDTRLFSSGKVLSGRKSLSTWMLKNCVHCFPNSSGGFV